MSSWTTDQTSMKWFDCSHEPQRANRPAISRQINGHKHEKKYQGINTNKWYVTNTYQEMLFLGIYLFLPENLPESPGSCQIGSFQEIKNVNKLLNLDTATRPGSPESDGISQNLPEPKYTNESTSITKGKYLLVLISWYLFILFLSSFWSKSSEVRWSGQYI